MRMEIFAVFDLFHMNCSIAILKTYVSIKGVHDLLCINGAAVRVHAYRHAWYLYVVVLFKFRTIRNAIQYKPF